MRSLLQHWIPVHINPVDRPQEVVPVRRPGPRRGRAAFLYTMIGTARLNDVDPQPWLADVLAQIADILQIRLNELLPWNWKVTVDRLPVAA